MRNLEEEFIRHCAPTLASLKPANLFASRYESEAELTEMIAYWNVKLGEKGIWIKALRKTKGRALIYVCRRQALEARIREPETAEFLKDYGYGDGEFSESIAHLEKRLAEEEEFPHEIGVFLGYPLEDVRGFIENVGQNFVCLGFWKAYGDRETAEKTFQKYRRCTEIYTRLWENGRSILKLTVAA